MKRNWTYAIAVAALLGACSDHAEDSDPQGTAARGGAGGGGGASAAAGSGGAKPSEAGEGAAGSPPSAGSSGMFTMMGVCGQRGQSMVTATTFTGYEEYFIIGDRGLGDDICVVRFDVTRVGDAPEGCDDPTADVECIWTHLVELSNPKVMIDEGGVCANSELGLDMAKLEEIAGTRVAYGFVSEFAGHNSVLMKYDASMSKWDAAGNATWDEAAGALRYDRREGFCNY